ncbi:MAG: DedA family protein [Longimicrobiales bacterium]
MPPAAVYVVLGLGAAIENIIPPVPADTFVLLGGFLSASERVSPWLVFLSTWVANVASALLVYGLARRWGRHIFDTGLGRWLLKPKQLDRIGQFYERWGTPAILVSRFLPAFRAIVPVFAGVSRLPWPRVAIPLALASAVWYGMLIAVGSLTGRNWGTIVKLFDRVSIVLLVIASLLLALFARWWWRTRHEEH